MSCRNICFTINHPDGMLYPEEWPTCTYCIYQHEVGENGTDHFQGYAEFSGKHRFAWYAKLPGFERAHFEVRRGTGPQASAYCSKDEGRLDGPWEWGEMKEQGKRSDLLQIKRKLDQEVPMQTIADDHFGSWIRYHKAFETYKLMKTKPRDWAMELIFIIGPSGTGKTRLARDLCEGVTSYWKPLGQWWDDYHGEHTVIWDEFYGHSYKFSELLQVLDRYPVKVQTKGGYRQFASKRIIFTSNQHPKDWYSGERTHQMVWEENPLCRRIREFGRLLQTGDIHVARPEQVQRVTFDEATGNWSDALPADLN